MLKRFPALAAACLFAAVPAAAQSPPPEPPQPCVSMAEAAANLDRNYGERPAMGGVTLDGNVIMIFANHATGTWTALLGIPNQPCARMIGAGTDWIVAPPPPPREADT